MTLCIEMIIIDDCVRACGRAPVRARSNMRLIVRPLNLDVSLDILIILFSRAS